MVREGGRSAWGTLVLTLSQTARGRWLRSLRTPNGAGERATGIPSGQHNGLCVKRGTQCRWQIALARGDFEQILVEPRVVHEVEPFLAAVLAPGVLDAPASRPPVNHIDASKEHGVCHLGLVIHQTLRL